MHRQLVHGLEVDQRRDPSRDGTVDLIVHRPPTSVDDDGQLVDLLDFADEFAARERLLSVARTPEQRTFQTLVPQRVRPPARSGRAPRGLVRPRRRTALRRSRAREPGVVDAEVVGDLVDDGDPDLVRELVPSSQKSSSGFRNTRIRSGRCTAGSPYRSVSAIPS